ncbi:MAG: hypothetical protein ABI833_17255, partial [Acidobacteriota bacterium]
MKFYWLVLGALAVLRITHLLNAEDGPLDFFARLRGLAGKGLWGDLLDCSYCLSLWIAIPFAWWLGDAWKERFMLWPGLSAASILIERLTSRVYEREPGPAQYFEIPEGDENVMLRTQERGFENANRVYGSGFATPPGAVERGNPAGY